MSDVDKQMLKAQFQKLDRNGYGIVTTNDIAYFMQTKVDNMDEYSAQQAANKLMNMMDTSNKGEITFKDFVRAKTLSHLHSILGSRQEIQLKGLQVLETFGTNSNSCSIKNGHLDIKTFKDILSKSMSQHETNQFIKSMETIQFRTSENDDGDEDNDDDVDVDNDENENKDGGDLIMIDNSDNSSKSTNTTPLTVDLKVVKLLGSVNTRQIDAELEKTIVSTIKHANTTQGGLNLNTLQLNNVAGLSMLATTTNEIQRDVKDCTINESNEVKEEYNDDDNNDKVGDANVSDLFSVVHLSELGITEYIENLTITDDKVNDDNENQGIMSNQSIAF